MIWIRQKNNYICHLLRFKTTERGAMGVGADLLEEFNKRVTGISKATYRWNYTWVINNGVQVYIMKKNELLNQLIHFNEEACNCQVVLDGVHIVSKYKSESKLDTKNVNQAFEELGFSHIRVRKKLWKGYKLSYWRSSMCILYITWAGSYYMTLDLYRSIHPEENTMHSTLHQMTGIVRNCTRNSGFNKGSD